LAALNSYLRFFLNLSVNKNIRKNPPVVTPHDSAFTVLSNMIRDDIGAVIVVEENIPIGIITEKDMLNRVFHEGRELNTTKAEEIMSSPLITIDSKEPINNGLKLLKENDIKRLIITEDNYLLGLTTERRLLETLHEQYILKNSKVITRVLNDKGYKINVGYVSTFPPRQCGIATYTYDLVESISRLYATGPPIIIAINEKEDFYDYSSLVKFQIDRDELDSYTRVAREINNSNIDIINIQHEFGLFGGLFGDNIVKFLEEIKKPVVTNLHTIPQDPSPVLKNVLNDIIKESDFVTIMAEIGRNVLENNYEISIDSIRYVPHGCPNVPFISSNTVKNILGLNNRNILSTFGLLSQGKGIEYVIKALPSIIEFDPNILYLIIGETHPEVRKHEGESYRLYLRDLIGQLGVNDNVKFVNRFLDKNELIKYLQSTDIYIIPYPNKDQISSGTLLYALSTGKAIISTPFLHAKEIISQGIINECEFKDPVSISDSVVRLLKDRNLLEEYQQLAYQYSRDMIWANVAMKYINVLYEALNL
jgi:glycosyltransferase involved in cell wall biosynthesis/CBS domain-containing protein